MHDYRQAQPNNGLGQLNEWPSGPRTNRSLRNRKAEGPRKRAKSPAIQIARAIGPGDSATDLSLVVPPTLEAQRADRSRLFSMPTNGRPVGPLLGMWGHFTRADGPGYLNKWPVGPSASDDRVHCPKLSRRHCSNMECSAMANSNHKWNSVGFQLTRRHCGLQERSSVVVSTSFARFCHMLSHEITLQRVLQISTVNRFGIVCSSRHAYTLRFLTLREATNPVKGYSSAFKSFPSKVVCTHLSSPICHSVLVANALASLIDCSMKTRDA
jgi:hypothetical protein